MADPSQLAWLEHFKIGRDAAASSSRRRQADNWVRGETIGSGTFGQVYVESNSKTNKFRAVKEIRKRSKEQDLNSELLALTRLSKPAYEEYFVQFLGWYDDHWILSLIMEYFELGDLRKHMLSATPESEPRVFPEFEAREIVLQLFFGLQAMHRDGFAHRDLKPENIFVVRKDPWHIKIGDFGISKRVLDNETFLRTLEIGTRSYMAPEVLELLPRELESSTYHNTVDIWAGGIILYELLCAAKPFFRSRSLSEYCFGQRELPTVSLLSQGVSDAGMALIEQLLQVVPSDRPDADTVLEAEWFDLEIREFPQDKDKVKSPASTSGTKPSAPSTFPASQHFPSSSLPERSLTAVQTFQTGDFYSEAHRRKPRASSRRQAAWDQMAQQDQSGGEFGQAHKMPALAKAPPATTIARSTLVQPPGSNNSKTIRRAILPQESAKEVEAVESEDTLVPWSFSEASLLKSNINEPEARSSPWRKYPLKFPGTINDTHHQTMRRQGAAACVSDSNVAFVIGGVLPGGPLIKYAYDTWKLTISGEDIVCTPVEASGQPKWHNHWVGMIDSNLVYICRDLASPWKLHSLDQAQEEWREYDERLHHVGSPPYCTVGGNLIMYNGVAEKSWRNIALKGTRYGWAFEIHTMNLSKIASMPPNVPLPPWKLSTRQPCGEEISLRRYCAMIEYRGSVIIFGEDFIRQFDPTNKTTDKLPMLRLDRRDGFLALAVIDDCLYVYDTFHLGGELFALHIPTRKWRRLKPNLRSGDSKLREEFTLLAMGTRLMLFGGKSKETADDYVTQPNGNRTECVWVLDTAENLEWEDI